MVHPTIGESRGQSRDSPHSRVPDNQPRLTEPLEQRYVFIPDSIITAFAHDPFAIGVYTAIARLAVVAKTAVALSARDLAVWMGHDTESVRAAIMRRIVKLEARGWLHVTRVSARKHQLLPGWGRDQMGADRPWRFDVTHYDRPTHVRGRRVPLGLFDDYLGRLDPQPGTGRALISRYFTRPLLDLTDIGVYIVGLRAEILPTPRLLHLGLHTAAGMALPMDGRVLREQAAHGQLTTLWQEQVVPVGLSTHGHIAFSPSLTAREIPLRAETNQLSRSPRRSGDGSHGRSLQPDAASPRLADQHASSGACTPSRVEITWTHGKKYEQINHDSTTNHPCGEDGGGAADSAYVGVIPDHLSCAVPGQRDAEAIIGDSKSATWGNLDIAVIAGHQALNGPRPIWLGEWQELRLLQERHGVPNLLMWQARASRAAVARPRGITPAYYQACAGRAACAAHHQRTPEQLPAASLASPHPAQPAPLLSDCDAMLRAMGVAERQRLHAIPAATIAAWQAALAHPGMAAQFRSPVGFAVTQMQRGNRPPSLVELDRWATRAQRTDDRYESWRCLPSAALPPDQAMQEHAIEARVRTLAPPDADMTMLCLLAHAIEFGATDAEALAQLQRPPTGACP